MPAPTRGAQVQTQAREQSCTRLPRAPSNHLPDLQRITRQGKTSKTKTTQARTTKGRNCRKGQFGLLWTRAWPTRLELEQARQRVVEVALAWWRPTPAWRMWPESSKIGPPKWSSLSPDWPHRQDASAPETQKSTKLEPEFDRRTQNAVNRLPPEAPTPLVSPPDQPKMEVRSTHRCHPGSPCTAWGNDWCFRHGMALAVALPGLPNHLETSKTHRKHVHDAVQLPFRSKHPFTTLSANPARIDLAQTEMHPHGAPTDQCPALARICSMASRSCPVRALSSSKRPSPQERPPPPCRPAKPKIDPAASELLPSSNLTPDKLGLIPPLLEEPCLGCG